MILGGGGDLYDLACLTYSLKLSTAPALTINVLQGKRHVDLCS